MLCLERCDKLIVWDLIMSITALDLLSVKLALTGWSLLSSMSLVEVDAKPSCLLRPICSQLSRFTSGMRTSMVDRNRERGEGVCLGCLSRLHVARKR